MTAERHHSLPMDKGEFLSESAGNCKRLQKFPPWLQPAIRQLVSAETHLDRDESVIKPYVHFLYCKRLQSVLLVVSRIARQLKGEK